MVMRSIGNADGKMARDRNEEGKSEQATKDQERGKSEGRAEARSREAEREGRGGGRCECERVQRHRESHSGKGDVRQIRLNDFLGTKLGAHHYGPSLSILSRGGGRVRMRMRSTC